MRWLAAVSLLCLVLLSGITGCGGSSSGGGGSKSPTVGSVTVACTPTTVALGATSSCAATVAGSGGFSTAVTWAASPASVGSVNSSGVFTPVATGTATVTATSTEDSSKSGSATVTVNPVAPSGFSYAQGTVSATVGVTITPDVPTITGTVSSYSVSPALPAGLSLDTATGVISGTPTAVAALAAYTVTAANSAGSATAQVSIAVAIAPPSKLIYAQATVSATVGVAIASDLPTVVGTVSSYSVSPALPAGLSLDTASGVISGTPTAVAALAAYTVTAANSAGSATAQVSIAVAIAPPSNLVYSPGTLSATVGVAFNSNAPTVTGVVSSYTVSPALPAGLSIGAATGIISGFPTAATPEATYTVKATNAAGSTTVGVSIVVTIPAPSSLSYSAISTPAGIAITQDVANVIGSVSSYSVSPALPAGLSLNATTGAITGAPTTAAAQANYTVTATNSGGSTKGTVSITVLPAVNVIADLGHGSEVQAIRFVGGRVLSQDLDAHWVLWDYASRLPLASGDGAKSYINSQKPVIDMAGSTIAIAIENAVEIRAISDGHLMATLPNGNNYDWRLATDGSYLCEQGPSGLSIYSLNGTVMAYTAGFFSNFVATPGKVYAAVGNVIYTLSAVDGTTTMSAPFSGSFYGWFADGSHFLTNASTTVWVYSAAGVQQAATVLPTIQNLGGTGNWFWTEAYTNNGGSYAYQTEIYAIGSDTPALTLTSVTGQLALVASGSTLGLLSDGPGKVSVLDLSGAAPVEKDYTVPIAYLNPHAYAASSNTQWVVGNRWAAVYDGASPSGAPGYFGLGRVRSIAGADGTVAAATGNGAISVYDPSTDALKQTINFSSSGLQLSSDGTVLGAAANAVDSQYEMDRTLNFYSLPSGNVISTFPYTEGSENTYLLDYALSGSGTTIEQLVASDSAGWSYTRKISDISGSPVSHSDNSGEPVFLSPDGSLAAIYPGTPDNPSDAGTPLAGVSTTILKNGAVVAAVPGMAIGWIDDNRLLVDNYTADSSGNVRFAGSYIYSSTGVLLASPALPALSAFAVYDSDTIYAPAYNTLYSLTTGKAIWTGTLPASGAGAVAGTEIVYQWGHRVIGVTPDPH